MPDTVRLPATVIFVVWTSLNLLVEDPRATESSVLGMMLDAKEPVTVMSSPVPSPRETAPSRDVAPVTVSEPSELDAVVDTPPGTFSWLWNVVFAQTVIDVISPATYAALSAASWVAGLASA